LAWEDEDEDDEHAPNPAPIAGRKSCDSCDCLPGEECHFYKIHGE
jgi:hypothetical protein